MRLFSWFGFCLFVLCSLTVTTGQSNLICSSQPIVATAGDDVILPCRLDPPISASSRAVEWTRPGLDPKYIHVHQDGRLVHPLYNYRTTLFVDQLINGNVSLKLFRVKLSDAGEYKCFLPSLWEEASIQLIVGAASIFTSDCIPMAATCASAVLVLGVIVLLAVLCKRKHWSQKEEQDKEQMRGLKEMIDQLIKLLEKVEAEKKKNRENLQSVETEIERLQSENKPVPEELIREKENLLQSQWKLDEIKRNYEGLKMKMEKLLE